jgi:hypothetical protein
MSPKKTGQLSYRGYNVIGGQVHINVSYLLRIIRAARNRQENERNIAALVRRRDRLAYDDVALEISTLARDGLQVLHTATMSS